MKVRGLLILVMAFSAAFKWILTSRGRTVGSIYVDTVRRITGRYKSSSPLAVVDTTIEDGDLGPQLPECVVLFNEGLTLDKGDDLLVNEFKWFATHKGYWFRTTDSMPMTNFLMGVPPEGYTWDHIDMNPRNNSRSNLRLATLTQQNANRIKQKGNYTSKYKGVSWYPNAKKWQVKIGINGKRKHVGYFKSEEEAARAYDEAAKEYFGEFARTNF